MLGAAHAAANPLTARFGVPHGQAVGLLLPRGSGIQCARPARARTLYGAFRGHAELGPIEEFIEELGVVLLDVAKMREANLSKFGIEIQKSAFGDLAKEAAQQWTAGFNPRPIAAEDFAQLYEEVSSNESGAHFPYSRWPLLAGLWLALI